MKLRLKKAFAILLSLMMLAASFPMGNAPAYAGEPTVIEITTPEQLDEVRNNLSGHYRLGNDINLGGENGVYGAGYDGGKGWEPITNFSGTFDGAGYSVIGLYINRPGESDIGLFSTVTATAQIFDLGLEDVDVKGYSYVGGLVGQNDGSISKSYATGQVEGDKYVGGLVGWNESEINESHVEADVSSNGEYTGGLTSVNNGGSISDSYVKGDVSGANNVGGLTGFNWSGSISNSYVNGEVTGASFVGGLAGYNYQGGSISQSYVEGDVSGSGDFVGGLVSGVEGGSISRSYVKGDVSGSGNSVGGLVGATIDCSISQSYSVGQIEGDDGVGGLVGYNEDSDISESYSMGNLSAADGVGGLVGYNDGSNISQSFAVGEVISNGDNAGGLVGQNEDGNINDCYWDIQTSGWDTSAGGSGAIGLTTEQMKRRAYFVDWDFEETWTILRSQTYPYFKWQQDDDAPVGDPSTDAAVNTKASHYIIDNDDNTIDADETPISTNVTVEDFLDNLEKDEKAEWKIVSEATVIANPSNFVNAEGKDDEETLAVGDKLAVLAEDDDTLKVYTITVVEAPIKIKTAQELDQVRNNLSGHYILDNDINLKDYLDEDGPGYNGGSGWQPIPAFKGSFDGNGHTIKGLYINRTSQSYVGLFAEISNGAQIRDLGLVEVDVEGKLYVGGLAGITYGSISDSYVEGDVSGLDQVGGLVGYMYNASSISQSYVAGNVTGNNTVGGLVGYNIGSISKSYAAGKVEGSNTVGGLVGGNRTQGSISESYSTGKVKGFFYVGGLVGYTDGSGFISESYAAGKVEGISSVGGLAGQSMSGKIRDCYWDTDTTGQLVAGGGIFSGATGRTTEQMKQQDTFKKENNDAWDFSNVWTIVEGQTYPYFHWQTPTVVAPRITAQPQNQTVIAGQTATFTVTAAGTEPLKYQWQKNGEAIDGATGPVLTINNAQADDAGSYSVVVSNEVDTVVSEEATLRVNEPGSLILTAGLYNARVILEWNSVSEVVYYEVYKNGSKIATTEDSDNSYEVSGLTNGTTYQFEVKAKDIDHVVIAASGQISATPRTVSGVPTNIRVTAGNGRATVTFSVPEGNGGSPITGYIVTANPGNIVVSGTSSPITVTGLTNGTSYTFTVKAVNEAGESASSVVSNAVTPRKPSSGGGGEGGSTPVTTPATDVNLIPGTANTTKVGDKNVTTVTLDDKKVEEKLEKEGRNAVITISVKTGADVVIGQLNGQTVKNMENKDAVLEIKTDKVTYVLPAAQINIDAVSEQMGKQVELKDILINVKISASVQDTVRLVKDAANKNNFQVVGEPVEFEITCTGSKTVGVSKFNAYVERMVAIPDGIDPSKITTGIVFNADGTFSHVPTVITVIDDQYYAKINSLTNSTYSLIWSPKNFKDVEKHWAKEAVNDMGSRLVVSGGGEGTFEPDRDITRAEFASIVVRGLGLMRSGTGKAAFNDVTKNAWYYDAVSIAYEYGIISGYGSGKFGPMDKITREQAMTMIAKAMNLTGLKAKLTKGEAEQLLAGYGDGSSSADYAKTGIAACVKAGIVTGRTGNLVAPKDNVTRAEVAAIVRGLLQKSNLI